MIETRTLIRDVIIDRDGKQEHRTETVECELRFPGGIDERTRGDYIAVGCWQLIPKPAAEIVDATTHAKYILAGPQAERVGEGK